MPIDWSKLSDEELLANAPSLGGNSAPVQPAQNPSITMAPNRIEPAQGNIVFTGAGGIESLPGKVASGNVDTQLAVDKQSALTPGEVEAQGLKTEASKLAEKNVVRKEFLDSSASFFSVDEDIPRGEGFHRVETGLNSAWKAQGREDLHGILSATHKAATLNFRNAIARMRDVGNISASEASAAEQMIPSLWDDDKTAQLKRAYIKQMGSVIGDKNMVVELINKWKKEEAFDKESHAKKTNNVDVNKYFTRKSSVGSFKI